LDSGDKRLKIFRVYAEVKSCFCKPWAIRWFKHCNLLITFLLALKANVYLFTAVDNYICCPFAFSFFDMSTSTVTTCLSEVLLCFLCLHMYQGTEKRYLCPGDS